MTAKDYLKQARSLKFKIDSMTEQLRSLRDAVENVSPALSGMPRPATPRLQKTEEAVVSMMDMENKLCEAFEKLVGIHATISNVTDPLRQMVLVYRYIQDKDWSVIATDMKFSVRRVYQIHGDALRDVDKLLKSLQ